MRRPGEPYLRLATYLKVTWSWLCLSLVLLRGAQCMTDGEIDALREETRGMFYHGLDNYYKHAYPEDELRPLTCQPLTRDRENSAHIELNDALGNYSLSLVDSLSTLAIFASNPLSPNDKHNAIRDFQEAVVSIIADYGDGSDGPNAQGRRARGFDLDSKVQVFETVIRGVGGLLSAHLFAIGELPIKAYNVTARRRKGSTTGITWDVKGEWGRKFVYDGQLLRLAVDLAQRILPSFTTPSGLPYPRVNLRHGVDFYKYNLREPSTDPNQCPVQGEALPARERTETCSAGAGSLTLEFATLSHLTGNPVYLEVAKKAFLAVWDRRSPINLVGSGIDAETGMWVSPVTGIGAGIDSFFEYAYKTHILLSGRLSGVNQNLSDTFLAIWQDAHTGISRHIHRGSQFQHPHYAQNDKDTGGLRFTWIDSLSAFYPGLLALAGELEEAQATHLLYAALWTRYGALPERWNVVTGEIEGGLRWWGGRPEFIESTWYLYRATKDPWYLRVGEMVLRDIKRRCYTPCGWAGLQDVTTGEKNDRMESFFLGETIKYLYLLFDRDHPLNNIDANYVFTTEGHPLILPKQKHNENDPTKTHATSDEQPRSPSDEAAQCPVPPNPSGLLSSVVVSRADLFHAAVASKLISKSGVRKQQAPNAHQPTETQEFPEQDVDALPQVNHIFYPWTMPDSMIPPQGFSARLNTPRSFELTFPMAQNSQLDFGALQRVDGGILINSVNGLRFGLVLDRNFENAAMSTYRIHTLSSLALGRDENIWLASKVVDQLQPIDPQLSRVKDLDAAGLYIDVPVSPIVQSTTQHDTGSASSDTPQLFDILKTLQDKVATIPEAHSDARRHLDTLLASLPPNMPDLSPILNSGADPKEILTHLSKAASDLLATQPPPSTPTQITPAIQRYSIPCALNAGPGAATIPTDLETSQSRSIPHDMQISNLPYKRVYILDSDLCDVTLPIHIARTYQVLVIKRGGCRFDDKLRRIPSFAPGNGSLRLVVVVSFPVGAGGVSAQARASAEGRNGDEDDNEEAADAVRPYIEHEQVTMSGVKRRHPIAVIMIGGGRGSWKTLERAATGAGREVEGQIVDTGVVNDGDEKSGRAGVGIRRRYWFESEGIRVANLLVH